MAKTRKAPTFRAPKVLRQTFGPFKGMRTAVEERASDPSLVDYALNMTCADPEHGAAYTLRPQGVVTSGLPAVPVKFFHVFETANRPLPVCMPSGQGLWSLPTDTAWTQLVTAIDFATAGIGLSTVSTAWFALTFAGKMIVSDGVNTPWMWDGTAGSAGLTLLSACPPLYGQMTEYAGKMMGIKADDHHTIVWCEENDPTTGYEAGGFNNAWTISQQADTGLVQLLGRNDGLYYWRSQSFGVIQGAVAGEFRTTHTHDAISSSVGLATPGAACDSGDALWWYSTNERVYCYPIGASPIDVSPEVTTEHPRQFDVGDDLVPLVVPRWWRPGILSLLADARAILVGPNTVNDRQQVWFSLPGFFDNGGTAAASGASIVLAYDVATRRPLSWQSRTTSLGDFTHLSSFTDVARQYGQFAISYGSEVRAPVLWCWRKNGIATTEGGAAIVGTLIGPVAGGTDSVEMTWTRIDVSTRLPRKGVTESGATLALQPVTPLERDPNPLSTFVTASPTELTTGKVTFGLDSVGRWLRPVFTLQWNGIALGYGIQGYTVQGTAASEDPDAA